MINTLSLTLQLSNLFSWLSFSTCKHLCVASFVLFYQISQKNSELKNHPQYLPGLAHALFVTTFLDMAVILYLWYVSVVVFSSVAWPTRSVPSTRLISISTISATETHTARVGPIWTNTWQSGNFYVLTLCSGLL